jgi:hypothetical protein
VYQDWSGVLGESYQCQYLLQCKFHDLKIGAKHTGDNQSATFLIIVLLEFDCDIERGTAVVDRLVGERDESEFFNRVVCIRNEFSKEDITERFQRGQKLQSCEDSPVRVERLDDYFAKTGNIALSNGAKMSQQPVVDDIHVLGIRAWPAGHLGRRQRPGREQVRAMRAREGWGERSALVRGDVDKRELTRTLRGDEEREGKPSLYLDRAALHSNLDPPRSLWATYRNYTARHPKSGVYAEIVCRK